MILSNDNFGLRKLVFERDAAMVRIERAGMTNSYTGSREVIMSQAARIDQRPHSNDQRLKAVLRAGRWAWLAYANGRPLQPLCGSEDAASRLADFVEALQNVAEGEIELLQLNDFYIKELDPRDLGIPPERYIFQSRYSEIILTTFQGAAVCLRIFTSLKDAVAYAARWTPLPSQPDVVEPHDPEADKPPAAGK